MQLYIETPLIESRALSATAQRSVWLKLEAMQPTGSFKIRGVGLACSRHARNGARRFISSSGGNAGIAVAYAGRRLGVPVTVVVPESTSARATELIEQEGAELIVQGISWQEANTLAQSLVGNAEAFIHPFDDQLLWQGHASLVDEIAWTGCRPDTIVISVGGGGLLCGVVEGLRRNGWADIPIIAVETAGADSLAQSVRSGRRVVLEKITSVATSLGAKQVCEQAFTYCQQMRIQTAIVSDRSAVSACERFLSDQRILVEPACGAALALAYENSPALERFRTVVVVVCGGVTASLEQLARWSRELA